MRRLQPTPAPASVTSPLPHFAPMLASLAPSLPGGESFLYELKWDGIRALAYINRAQVQFLSRNDLPMARRYPELAPLWKQLARRRAILDGEIIALDERQRPSFPLLQHRMHVDDAGSIARLSASIPAYYIIFDLLYLDGESLVEQGFEARRRRLAEFLSEGDAWRLSPLSPDGDALLQAAEQQQMEGVIAKRRQSAYQPGRRSPDWLKVKLVASQEFVIGGWVPELGNTGSRVGSLLLGYYDDAGALHYAGRVGTGFNDQWHRRLTERFRALRSERTPFSGKVEGGGGIFLRPGLVAQVEYRRWPAGAMVQQAAFKGLRDDKEPRQVTDERRQLAPRPPAGGQGRRTHGRK